MLSEYGWFGAVKTRNYDKVIENVKEYHRSVDEEGNTGLMIALQKNDQYMMEILAPHEYGISNPEGLTALVQAMRTYNIDAVRTLAKYESRFKTADGMAPIHIAVQMENSSLISILLPYSAAELNLYNQNALEYAAANGKANAAFCLLSDPNIYGPEDVKSAALTANNSGYPDMARKLYNWLDSYNCAMSINGKSMTSTSTRLSNSLQASMTSTGRVGLEESARDVPRSLTSSSRNMYTSATYTSTTRPFSGMASSYGSFVERNAAHNDNLRLTPSYSAGNLRPSSNPRSPGSAMASSARSTKYGKPATENAFEYLQFKKTLADAETRPGSPAGSRSNSRTSSRSGSRTLGRTSSRTLRRGTGTLPTSFSTGALSMSMGGTGVGSRGPSRNRSGTPSGHYSVRGPNAFLHEKDPNFCSIFDPRTLVDRSPTMAFGATLGVPPDHNYNYVEHLPEKPQTHALYGPIVGYDPETINYTITGDIVPRQIVTDPIVNQYSRPDLTDLMIAAKLGRIQLVQDKAVEQFLKRSKTGRTALIYAAQRNFIDIAKVLLQYEAGASDTLGYTALMYAASFGHLEMVETLMSAEAGHRRQSDGATALMAAAANGHLQCVHKLVPLEGCIHSRNGTTALMLAIKYNHKECAYFLMKHELKGYDDSVSAVEQFCTECGREEYITDLLAHLRIH